MKDIFDFKPGLGRTWALRFISPVVVGLNLGSAVNAQGWQLAFDLLIVFSLTYSWFSREYLERGDFRSDKGEDLRIVRDYLYAEKARLDREDKERH